MLDRLPVEVLSTILVFVHTAQDVAHLSAASRRLHRLIEEDEEGWRVFVLNRFPSVVFPQCWKDAAHALTTLSRNLDRRAFMGSEMHPRNVLFVTDGFRKEHYSKQSKQTMGYQAMLDSYDQWTSTKWAARKEVLVWGAGAALMIRRSWTNVASQSRYIECHSKEARNNGPQSVTDWWVYQERLYREGWHDIVSTNLLRPEYRSQPEAIDDSEEVIIGRASGDLDHIRIHAGGRQVLRSYASADGCIRSVDLASPQSNLVVALGNQLLALYPLRGEDEPETVPVSTVDTDPQLSCHPWSARFISDDRVAVGRGLSKKFIHIYAVAEDGLRQEPIRAFGGGGERPVTTTAYPLVPLPSSLFDTENAEQCFLSGGYDGKIRLHDLRSPQDCELSIADPIDRTSIFSLATIGRERIIAGSSMNSLVKIFDLRMTGGRAYCYIDPSRLPSRTTQEQDPTRNIESKWVQSGFDSVYPSGFNVFANEPYGSRGGRMDNSSRRPRRSPVYSLSRPSQASPLLYIGLENSVNCFNFTSMYDAHPDPLFDGIICRSGPARSFNPATTWWSDRGSNQCFSLYEQRGSRNMRILSQQPPLHPRSKHQRQPLEGYDERLADVHGDRDARMPIRHRRR